MDSQNVHASEIAKGGGGHHVGGHHGNDYGSWGFGDGFFFDFGVPQPYYPEYYNQERYYYYQPNNRNNNVREEQNKEKNTQEKNGKVEIESQVPDTTSK